MSTGDKKLDFEDCKTYGGHKSQESRMSLEVFARYSKNQIQRDLFALMSRNVEDYDPTGTSSQARACTTEYTGRVSFLNAQ